MSNVEHLFENAIVALENDYHFGEWKRIEKDRHNTDGVSEEVLEAIWELAIYTKYTYEPSLNAIPVELIKKKLLSCQYEYENDYDKGFDKGWNCAIRTLLKDWEKENGKDSE